jgi:hypothetical protein
VKRRESTRALRAVREETVKQFDELADRVEADSKHPPPHEE